MQAANNGQQVMASYWPASQMAHVLVRIQVALELLAHSMPGISRASKASSL